MQLRHDDALGAVDDKRACAGHERNFAHVHFLLFNFFNSRLRDLTIKQHQAYFGTQWGGIGEAA